MTVPLLSKNVTCAYLNYNNNNNNNNNKFMVWWKQCDNVWHISSMPSKGELCCITVRAMLQICDDRQFTNKIQLKTWNQLITVLWHRLNIYGAAANRTIDTQATKYVKDVVCYAVLTHTKVTAGNMHGKQSSPRLRLAVYFHFAL